MFRKIQFFVAGLIAVVTVGCSGPAAYACDELAGRLLTKIIQPEIEKLGCQGLENLGLNRSEHRLESICYESSGPQSRISIAAMLKCRTGSGALIQSQVSERVRAHAEVRASDCQVLDLSVDAAGSLGKLLLRAFDSNGSARKALQDALSRAC
jgi:hypothetical protein